SPPAGALPKPGGGRLQPRQPLQHRVGPALRLPHDPHHGGLGLRARHRARAGGPTRGDLITTRRLPILLVALAFVVAAAIAAVIASRPDDKHTSAPGLDQTRPVTVT